MHLIIHFFDLELLVMDDSIKLISYKPFGLFQCALTRNMQILQLSEAPQAKSLC